MLWPDGPKEAIPFISKLIFRHKKLTSSSLDLLDCVDLSWFMRPRAYFAALKQHFARKLDKPLENLEIRVNWSGNRSQSGEKMVLIEGLFLTGNFFLCMFRCFFFLVCKCLTLFILLHL